jgi:hypothetical protein
MAQLYVCAFCGAQAWGGPPHGENQPCPTQVSVLDAQKDLLEAQAEATRKNIKQT